MIHAEPMVNVRDLRVLPVTSHLRVLRRVQEADLTAPDHVVAHVADLCHVVGADHVAGLVIRQGILTGALAGVEVSIVPQKV